MCSDVDEANAAGQLWLGGTKLFSVFIKVKSVNIENEEGWKEWFEDTDYPELKTNIVELKEKLARST